MTFYWWNDEPLTRADVRLGEPGHLGQLDRPAAGGAEHPVLDVGGQRLVADAIAEGEAGMALAELGDSERGGWYTQLVDQAIAWFAQTGTRFSANEVRELLPPDFPAKGLMGARFQHAANNLDLIHAVSGVRSTKKNTHGKPVTLWVGVTTEEPTS